jgi:hypothetical protein
MRGLVPTILLAAWARAENLRQCYDPGADFFTKRPLTFANNG